MRILNVITSGLKREGITSSQLEIFRRMDFTDLHIDMLSVVEEARDVACSGAEAKRDAEGSDVSGEKKRGCGSADVVEEFRRLGCGVIQMPDRRRHPLRYITHLRKLLKSGSYDIIHVHGSSALMAMELYTAKCVGVPIRIAHSRNTVTEHPLVDRVLRPLFRRSYTHAWACGEDAGRWLFGDGEFTVLHNGKDLERYGFSEEVRRRIREEYGLEGRRVVGFVGNLNEQKNPEFLLRVFRALIDKEQGESSRQQGAMPAQEGANPEGQTQTEREPEAKRESLEKTDFRLFVVGDGEERERLEEEVAATLPPGSVTFTGRVANVHELLNAMDIMLLPSRWEGLPNVVLEWQANGLPSIISERITSECAVTSSVHFNSIEASPDLWAEEILELLASSGSHNCSQKSPSQSQKAGKKPDQTTTPDPSQSPSQSVSERNDEQRAECDARGEVSRRNCELLRESGFDVAETAVRCRKLYLDLYNEYAKNDTLHK